jgi:hypothetical protein
MPITSPATLNAAITLAWGQRVSREFALGVIGMSQRLGWGAEHPSWFMGCSAFETGESFSPNVRNLAGSGAIGLIQFMPATAAGLGTTVENLALLSAESQLAYVELYFRPYASRIASLDDMYMAILLPSAVGKPEDTVLFTQGTVAYRQNAALDANSDGKITKAEAAARVRAKLAKGLLTANVAHYSGIAA